MMLQKKVGYGMIFPMVKGVIPGLRELRELTAD